MQYQIFQIDIMKIVEQVKGEMQKKWVLMSEREFFFLYGIFLVNNDFLSNKLKLLYLS